MVTRHDGDSADFSVVRHGFDRDQVKQYLRRMEDDALRSVAERDEARGRVAELAGELEIARREITALTARLDQLAAAGGPDAERTLQVARTQAAEITARAKGAAETAWAGAEEASTALRDRYRRMLADLDRQHQELHADHKKIMEEVRRKSVELTVAADKRRQDLDDQAEQARKRIQREFDDDMAAQRAALAHELETERARAAEESRRVIAEATAEAERRIASATSQVERLTALREQLAGRLRDTNDLLTRSSGLLEPLEGEAELAPDSPADLTAKPGVDKPGVEKPEPAEKR